MSLKSRKGITLIEFVVLIAIIVGIVLLTTSFAGPTWGLIVFGAILLMYLILIIYIPVSEGKFAAKAAHIYFEARKSGADHFDALKEMVSACSKETDIWEFGYIQDYVKRASFGKNKLVDLSEVVFKIMSYHYRIPSYYGNSAANARNMIGRKIKEISVLYPEQANSGTEQK